MPAATVRSFARRHGLWHPRLRVLAAVSGGSDSVAMFLLLNQLAAAGELELAGLTHVNHHIRPGATDEDEAFCRALATRLGVPAVVAHADVPALAREHRQSIEVAARHARHRAFAEAAAELGADRIATAHTRDDQAETVLLHLARGAGLSGARGIEPQSGRLIRPMLDCTRADLQGWLTTIGERWREDETNADIANPRNRVRHVLLPALRDQLNPAVDAALVRFADILRVDHAYLSEVAAEAARQVISTAPDGLVIDGAALERLPRALARRVARIALETAHVRRSYDLEEVDALLDACSDAAQAPKELPGVRMERSGRFVVLHSRDTKQPMAEAFQYELSVPGQVSIEESQVVLEAEGPFDYAQDRPFDVPVREIEGPNQMVIRADELSDGLVVRNRRNGDRLRLWRVGHKKLQDLFVDRKVDRFERDRVPIVTDRSGRIVWVAGHAVAEEFRVNPLTNTVVILRLRPLVSRGPHHA
jgi:tRNA(Ile)-lysidine synthase